MPFGYLVFHLSESHWYQTFETANFLEILKNVIIITERSCMGKTDFFQDLVCICTGRFIFQHLTDCGDTNPYRLFYFPQSK